jgi:hypothetical protein
MIGKQRSPNLQRNTDSVLDSMARECAPSSINGRRRIANDVAPISSTRLAHVYEVRPRKDHRGVDLISDALPFGRLWYGEPDAITDAIGYAKFRSRSHDAVIRAFDEAGNMIEDARARGRFQRVVSDNNFRD